MTFDLNLIGFFLLGISFISLWIYRDPKIWGSLFALSILCELIEYKISITGVLIVIGWAVLWNIYKRSENRLLCFILFLLFILFSFDFKFHLFPGFSSTSLTKRFYTGFETAILGLFPLAMFVPLARSKEDWKAVLKGMILGIVGIGIIAIVATVMGVVHLQFKIPSYSWARFANNLFLVSIPEEGFYRGFLQNQISTYLHNTKLGKLAALLLTSILFTIAHMYWVSSYDMLLFVFIASLLYGGVYLISGQIESAILCHFLLNFIHMCCFSYHAM